jgi:hypothetical protein
MYKVNNPIDPNPANSFTSATATNFSVYTYGSTSSTTNWAFSTTDSTYFASMKMTNLSGGGTGFFPSGLPITNVQDINNKNTPLYIYPNPTQNEWYISTVELAGNSTLTFRLYTADGREVKNEPLSSGTVTTISTTNLPSGVYYYKINSENNSYTGSLIKN